MSRINSSQEIGGAPESMAAEVDCSSAMLRAEARQLEATLRALVSRLSSVPGLEISVSHRHGKLRRFLGDLPYINDLDRETGPIQSIVVRAGEHSYWLQCDSGTLRCGREIGTLSFSAWASELFEEIAKQNLANHDSLVALRQLVEHDQVG